jgi:S-adenosylmethionine hydrolase
MQKISERYGEKIAKLKEAYVTVESELLKLAKKEKSIIFDGRDIYDTRYGRLIREIAEKVGIPRGALEKCEELGFTEAIRISKSLDRAVIEGWPDERLFLIGAKRELKEKIIYELSREAT